MDKLYLLNAVTPDELTKGLIAYGMAKRHRVGHVVYHSVFAAERFKDVPHFASKLAVESALKAFDVPFTTPPNYFYQNDEPAQRRDQPGRGRTRCRSARRASRRWTCGTSPRRPRLC